MSGGRSERPESGPAKAETATSGLPSSTKEGSPSSNCTSLPGGWELPLVKSEETHLPETELDVKEESLMEESLMEAVPNSGPAIISGQPGASGGGGSKPGGCYLKAENVAGEEEEVCDILVDSNKSRVQDSKAAAVGNVSEASLVKEEPEEEEKCYRWTL